MSDNISASALVPRAEQVVDFQGDPITVAIVDDQAYVPLRAMTEFLGLTWAPQYQRIQRDEVLSRHTQLVEVEAADGKRYETLCLELSYLPGWLFGITASRVKEELRAKLIRYREDCFNVLWREFQGSLRPQSTGVTPTNAAPLEQVRGLALAIATLAEQQMEMDSRVELADQKGSTALARLDRAAELMRGLQHRLSQTENALMALDSQAVDHDEAIHDIRHLVGKLEEKIRQLPAPSERIGPAEKASLKALVDDVVAAADAKGMKLGQGRNNFQSVWSQFNRRFDLAKYEELTLAQYEDALGWLKTWRDRVEGGQV